MSMSFMFEKINAPLHNIIWSWGAATPDERIVYLRVWQDETITIDGKRYVHLLARDKFEGKKNLGYEERLRQLNLVRQGAECFVIFCEPRKPITSPRKVADYVKDRVFPTKDFLEHEGDLWIEFGGGIPLELHLARYEQPILKPAA
jgi:hypothetical protein